MASLRLQVFPFQLRLLPWLKHLVTPLYSLPYGRVSKLSCPLGHLSFQVITQHIEGRTFYVR